MAIRHHYVSAKLVRAVIAVRARSDIRYAKLLMRLDGLPGCGPIFSDQFGDVGVCFEMLQPLDTLDIDPDGMDLAGGSATRLVGVTEGLCDFLKARGYEDYGQDT